MTTAPRAPAQSTKPRRRWIRWTLGIALALPLLAALGLLALDAGNRPAAPDWKAIEAKAGRYDARIRRDPHGVPRITGATDADVAFGLAWAHAEDDFDSIAEVILMSRGELSAHLGAEAAPRDYLLQLMDVRASVARAYPSLPADVRAILEGYADGVNAFGARNRDRVPAGMLPVTGQDLAAGFAFRSPFFFGLDRIFRDLASGKLGGAGPETGSNGVAVAPSRSADGATRLLLNSHQPFLGQVAWYEAVLESGQGWHVAGGFFPGSPFMLYGVTPGLGWATTVNRPDLADVYRLEVDSADPTRYRLDGRWVPFVRGTARMRVHLWGPFYWTEKRPILRSRHGPVFQNEHGYFAVRFAGIGETRQTVQYLAMNKARTRADWLEAMRLMHLPSINYVFADSRGTIGMVHNGQYPRRQPGLDWQGILPGNRSDLIWTNYLAFDRVPQIWNPRCGLVYAANHDPRKATACPDDGLDPAAIDPLLGLQTNMTNRGLRALEVYGPDSSIDAAEFERYKYDLAYSPASRMLTIARALAQPQPGDDAELRAARELVAGWNGRGDRANRSAALAILAVRPILGEDGDPLPDAAEMTRSLKEAAAALREGHGRMDPAWGEVNRLRRAQADLALDGGPDLFRAVSGKLGADGRVTADTGDSLVIFATWDRQGRLTARSVQPFGANSGDPKSRHHSDQMALFAAHRTKPLYITEAEFAGKAVSDYRVGSSAPARTGQIR